MSYRLKIDDKSRKAGRFIGKTHRELQAAFVASGLKQYQLAEILGCNKSHVNRVLTGKENLTLRTLAEFAWALGYKPEFKMREINVQPGTNIRQVDASSSFNGILGMGSGNSVQSKSSPIDSKSNTRIFGYVDA